MGKVSTQGDSGVRLKLENAHQREMSLPDELHDGDGQAICSTTSSPQIVFGLVYFNSLST